jgi:type IV fimbrial biogenesis protein FimT
MFRPLKPHRGGARGLTLVELLVAMVVAAILLVIAVPPVQDFILMQRLRGINAQLVTDLQYARSEAPQRNQYVSLYFQSNAQRSCYVIYTSTPTAALRANRCTCLDSAESVCGQGATALRTVRLPASDRVGLRLPAGQSFGFAYDHIAGGIVTVGRDIYGNPLGSFWIESYIDANRVLRNEITQSGRVTVCAPASTTVGAPAC